LRIAQTSQNEEYRYKKYNVAVHCFPSKCWDMLDKNEESVKANLVKSHKILLILNDRLEI
jgi:hypothetical protein